MILLRLIAMFWKPIAAILAAWGLRADARRDARVQAKLDAAAGYINTTKAVNDAEIHGNDPDAARRWLSERDAGKP